jgi:hypothetical protein
VIFTHGAFVFLGGVGEPPLIRATVELVSWLRASMRQTELLGSTLGVMCDVMIKSGKGEQPCYEIRMTLPCSTTDFTEKKWVSSGWP